MTPAGERLLPLARRILRLLAEAQAAVLSRESPTRLRLGLTSAIEPQWFQKIAASVESQGFVLDVIADESPQLVRMLGRGKLDAAFIALPTHAPGVDVHVLDEQPLVAVLPSGHRLAQRKVVGLAELAGDPLHWFRRARQPAFFDQCAQIFERHGFAPRIIDEPRITMSCWRKSPPGAGLRCFPHRSSGCVATASRTSDCVQGPGCASASVSPRCRIETTSAGPSCDSSMGGREHQGPCEGARPASWNTPHSRATPTAQPAR